MGKEFKILFITLFFIFLYLFIFQNNKYEIKLIEALTNYEINDKNCYIDRRNLPCSEEYSGWDEEDLRENYKKYFNFNPDDSTINSCNKYDNLCLSEPTNASDCKEVCDKLPNCGSFSVSSDTDEGRCCLYKIGYTGDVTTEYMHLESNEKCHTKKNCEINKINNFDSCICGNENKETCSKFSICHSDDNGLTSTCLNPSNSNNAYEKLYLNLRDLSSSDSSKICSTEETISNEQGEPFCICEYNNLSDSDPMKLPPNPTENDYKNRICPYANDICNNKSFTKNLGCYKINNETVELPDLTCNYNLIDNSANIRDSDILKSEDYNEFQDNFCYCNVNQDGIASAEHNNYPDDARCNFDDNNYCRSRDNSCQKLNNCLSSNNILDESCLYELNGEQTMCNFLNSSGIKDKIFLNDECKSIDFCTKFDAELEENEHCFCPLAESINDVHHLCIPGNICDSTRGCVGRKNCSNGFTYNEELNKCVQPTCRYYSENNDSSIATDCICDTDPNHTSENPFVCQRNHYCLNSEITPNIPLSGCQSYNNLKEDCVEYSENNTSSITKKCYCGTNSSGTPLVCEIGKYCVDSKCRDISCKDDNHIIDPNDHTKCGPKNAINNSKSEFETLINEFKKLINEYKKKIKDSIKEK